MKINEYTPEHILLTSDFLGATVREEQQRMEQLSQKESGKNNTISFGVAAVTILVSLLSAYSALGALVRVLLIVFAGAFAVGAVVYGTKWHDAAMMIKKLPQENLEEIALSASKRNIKYTAIIIIAYTDKKAGKQSKNNPLKILMGEDTFLSHTAMDSDKSIPDQKERIQKELLLDYGIEQHDILQINAMDDSGLLFSIKPVHDRIEMNAFAFYTVKLNTRERSRLLGNSDLKWKSLEEMQNDPRAMGVNKDVIDYLCEHKHEITDSFVNFSNNIRIIWNITNVCDYNCAICATHDESREELDTAGKLKVWNSIGTANNYITSIDFAGGDPCCSEDSISIIESAIQLFGSQRVTVTTTGKGIERLNDSRRAGLLNRCELTIDASHENLADSENHLFSRKEETYSVFNEKKIEDYADCFSKLMINIPILDDDLSEKEIQKIVGTIVALKKQNLRLEMETILIRLMPVGAQENEQDVDRYKKYNPVRVAKILKREIENTGVPCKYHCSLRVLPQINSKENRCEMLEHKIGIDCAGNVFSCAWSSYLTKYKDDILKSPFYLGNLTETSLLDIIEGRNRTQAYKNIQKKIENHNHRNFCSVVSDYVGNEVFKNRDPLAKKQGKDGGNG